MNSAIRETGNPPAALTSFAGRRFEVAEAHRTRKPGYVADWADLTARDGLGHLRAYRADRLNLRTTKPPFGPRSGAGASRYVAIEVATEVPSLNVYAGHSGAVTLTDTRLGGGSPTTNRSWCRGARETRTAGGPARGREIPGEAIAEQVEQTEQISSVGRPGVGHRAGPGGSQDSGAGTRSGRSAANLRPPYARLLSCQFT